MQIFIQNFNCFYGIIPLLQNIPGVT